MKTIFPAFFLLVNTHLLPAQNPLLMMINTDKQFAQRSRTNTTKDAFLTFMAPDALIFEKGKALNGPKYWQAAPESPGKLTWQPFAADVAASGDFGYTTGPWELRAKSLEDKPAAYGHFVTIWKKQPNNTWRAALDIGVSHPAPPSPPTNMLRAVTGIRSVTDLDTTKLKNELLAFDQRFVQTLEKSGPQTTYKSYLAPKARIYRTSQQPFIDYSTMGALFKDAPKLTFEPLGVSVAESGDLGYVYGNSQVTTTEAEKPTTKAGNFLRIWKKNSQGQWRIVLDVLAVE